MPLQALPCTTLDFPRLFEVEHAAWLDDPFTPMLFPGPFPPEVADFRIQEMARQLEEDPTTRWLKVVDTDSTKPEEGISFAKWHVYKDGPPKAQRRTFGAGCNVEACELLFGSLAQRHEQWIGGVSCVCMSRRSKEWLFHMANSLAFRSINSPHRP